MFLSDMEYFKNEAVEMLYIHKMSHFWPLHNHPGEYQILLVFEGRLEIGFGDGCLVLGPDEITVLPPLKAHTERALVPIKVLALSVRAAALQEDAASVLDLIDLVVEQLQRKGLIEVAHILSLSRAASHLLTLFRGKTDECCEFVARAREILEKWPEREISLDEMAEVVMTCRRHLGRVFKKQVGLTPHQFQIQNRVRKASLMLIGTDTPIDAVGKACGFYDKSHFKKHFRRLLGMSPHGYRSAFRQAKQLMW